jgi:hypothetical protein
MNMEAVVPFVVVLLMAIVGTEVAAQRLATALPTPGKLAGATLARFAWNGPDRAVLALEFAVRATRGSPQFWR